MACYLLKFKEVGHDPGAIHHTCTAQTQFGAMCAKNQSERLKYEVSSPIEQSLERVSIQQYG